MSEGIAIVGMACRYPDADSPTALWENVLARRRAFRRLPRVRLSLDDYLDAETSAPDTTYSSQAAVLRDWTFDRHRFRIAASAFASADIAHWLALEIADAALRDADLADSSDAARDRVGVIIGNTLTGDRTRANSMRLRWPFVARVVGAAFRDAGLDDARREALLGRIESEYKAPFAAVDENTLAGALSNTIAGRICNSFGFGGGGYTVDGACASSLLAIANACSMLETHDVDVVLAGGVDLSLDPFELVGFAKTAALAREEMFVYDRRANGFLPGEGCGLVVLKRAADARASGHRIYATIRGWGISSDGHGGLTRPEAAGQAKAIRRAYARAGFTIDSVTAFEGHGTGTPVGDAAEVTALLAELREQHGSAGASFIGSVKANIGHTKAAAGIAGFIKAAMTVSQGVIPPATACDEPLEVLADDAPLTIAREPMPWPETRPRRAAVSAFGFGGINTHLVLEAERSPRRALTVRERTLAASSQDAELFLFCASDPADLRERVGAVADRAAELSKSELTDLAVVLGRDTHRGAFRAAIVASTPNELAGHARALLERIAATRTFIDERIAFAHAAHEPRIALLFSGQGSPVLRDAAAWQRRFPDLGFEELWNDTRFAQAAAVGGTALAQPSIVAASLCALRVLENLGIRANAAAGHSLGELTALCWAGAIDERALLDIAFARGAVMQSLAGGRMAALTCSVATARPWLDGTRVTIASVNALEQCVISGNGTEVEGIVARARDAGVRATLLPVAAAFHSPAMAAAATALRAAFRDHATSSLARRVVSTVTGAALPAGIDVADLALTQLTAPVLFLDAVQVLAADADLLIEAGPGAVLTGIASSFVSIPVLSLDACGSSLAGLLSGTAAAFVVGVNVDREAMFARRFARPFDVHRTPVFIESPCENVASASRVTTVSPALKRDEPAAVSAASDPEQLLREVIAARIDLPVDLVTPESRLLRDLHLNSITVAHLLGEVVQRLRLPPLTAPTQFANASIAEIARALGELRETGGPAAPREELPAGVAEWVRTFTIERIAEPLVIRKAPALRNVVVSLVGDDAATAFARLLAASAEVRDGETLTVVQERPRGGGFARTLHLERPAVNVCVVTVDAADDAAMERVASESANADGFVEAFYERGERFVPRLTPHDIGSATEPLRATDVVLVSGGGKGIAAESALHLARRSGAAIGIIGRSDPATSAELAANLERFRSHGIRVHYASADVTDAAATRRAAGEVRDALGAITVVLHGAGANAPALIHELDNLQFQAAFAPKVDGLHNLLACCDTGALRLVIAFGSVIARTGMRGEAHYAFANEWLTAALAGFAAKQPDCRTLAVEWSVWSGAGMGERLGRVEALRRDGITPIGIDDAVSILESLVASDARGAIVVAGRLAAAPTLRMREPELPLLRFLEQPRVAVDGIEIVADARLTEGSEPYLRDHVFRGDALVPAVIGLEAMAQAASALRALALPSAFEDVDLRWPIVIGDGGTTVRVAALARGDSVDVVIRSSDTQFTVDHFRALATKCAPGEPEPLTIPAKAVPIDIDRDVYGALLFHQGRFRRVRSYRKLTATECIAEIDVRRDAWFAAYRPSRLVLGDPGVRDAAIHALQACIPHATVLPSRVESIEFLQSLPDEGSVFVHAHERVGAGDHFIYDLAVTDDAGAILERWRGLRLQLIEKRDAAPDLALPLWVPYLERRLAGLQGVPVTITVQHNSHRMHGVVPLLVMRRPDGKPDDVEGLCTSIAHAHDLTLTASSPGPIACDVESIDERSDAERLALLGPQSMSVARAIAAAANEEIAAAFTRVWTAHECTQKRHGVAASAFTIVDFDAGGGVTLAAGADRITTLIVGDGAGRRLVCGFLIDPLPLIDRAISEERRI